MICSQSSSGLLALSSSSDVSGSEPTEDYVTRGAARARPPSWLMLKTSRADCSNEFDRAQLSPSCLVSFQPEAWTELGYEPPSDALSVGVQFNLGCMDCTKSSPFFGDVSNMRNHRFDVSGVLA